VEGWSPGACARYEFQTCEWRGEGAMVRLRLKDQPVIMLVRRSWHMSKITVNA